MTTARGSIGQRSGLFLLSRVIGSAGFFVAVVILARALDPVGRGALAFITVTALSVGALVRLGVGDATIVMASRMPEVRRELLANLVLWTITSASCAGALTGFVLVLARERRPAGIGDIEVVLIAIGTLASALVEAGYPMLLATGRVREQTLVTAAGPWVYAVLLGAAAGRPAGLTVASAAVAWVLSQSVWGAALFVIAVRTIGLGAPRASLLKRTASFGVQVWLGSLASFLNARLDQLLVAVLSTTRSLGTYAVAVNAAEIVLYVPTAAAQALLSAVASDPPELRDARVARAFRAGLAVTVASCGAAAASGPILVPLVFGERYAESVLPFVLLLPGALGFCAIAILSPGLMLAMSPRLASIGPTVSLIFGTGLDLILIPGLGPAGASIAASTALLMGGAASLVAYKMRTRSPWNSFKPGRADLDLLRSLGRSALRALLRGHLS